jgi:hypothetical protein
MAFAVHSPRLGTLLTPSRGGDITDDAYSGFTHVADRAIAHARLRTQPLDHARGLRYQGPRRLPGPDSQRQAILNLSLLYVMTISFSSWRRNSLGARTNVTIRESGSTAPSPDVGHLSCALRA